MKLSISFYGQENLSDESEYARSIGAYNQLFSIAATDGTDSALCSNMLRVIARVIMK